MDAVAREQASDPALRRDLAELLPELRAFARFLAGTVSEADDLVQEALLRALDGGAERVAGTPLRPWCLAILRNVWREQTRARRRATAAATRHRDEASMFPVAPDSLSAAEQFRRSELDDLARALRRLPPLLREALVLVGAEGLSYEEAATVCRVPAGTMKARVSRARRQLAEVVGPVAS